MCTFGSLMILVVVIVVAITVVLVVFPHFLPGQCTAEGGRRGGGARRGVKYFVGCIHASMRQT